MKILYVDDQDTFGPQALRRAQHEVDLVLDGSRALKWYRKNGPYDLVLTDVDHPGLNGFELAKAIRAIDRYQSIGFVTTYDTGGYPRLHKPYDFMGIVRFAESTAHVPSYRRPAR